MSSLAMNRLKLLSITSFLIVCLASAPPVWAHSNLVRSDPPANSAQKLSPQQVRLWFSEDVEASFTSVRVLDTTGTQVDKGDSRRAPDDPKQMEVSVPELPLGLYTVAWQAISAVDGHATSGSFAFTVGDVPPIETSSREIMALVDSALSASAPPPAYDVIARWLNLLTLVALAGSFAFPLLIVFPAIQTAHGQPQKFSAEQIAGARAAWAQRWLRMLLVGFGLYVAATIVVLIAQALTAGGVQSIGRVLTATRFGMIWLLRAATLGALGALIRRARAQWANDMQADRAMRLGALLSVVLLITQSLNSHGAAVTDPPLLALTVDFIHLLGTVIWVGGLFQLALTLPAFIQSFAPKTRANALAIVIARFSFVVLLTVNVIVASGIYAMLVQVGSAEAFFATLYGQSLLIKIAAIGVVLAIAAFNLIVVRPSLAHATTQDAIRLTRQFKWATLLEAIGGIVILLIVGLLTSVAPARSAYDPSPKLVMQTQPIDDLIVTLGIAPGMVGTNDFDVKVRDTAGHPVSNASVVRLLGTMLDMEMGTQETTTSAQGDGHYTLRGDLLSMTGHWKVEALIRRDGRDDARTTFTLLALDQARGPDTLVLGRLLENPQTLLGLGMMLAAFVGGVGSVLVGRLARRERRATLAGAIGLSLLGLFVVVQTSAREANALPPGYVVIAPAAARTVRSPIAANAENLSAGRQLFQQYCTVCHGLGGKGNGPLAASLNPKPVDLTIHARLHTEGEEFWVLTNGIQGSAMPKWEETLNETQRWQVVAFIRTLGLAPATPAQTPAP